MKDLESGRQFYSDTKTKLSSKLSLLWLHRKWRSMPRFMKIYLPLLFVVASFIVIFYYSQFYKQQFINFDKKPGNERSEIQALSNLKLDPLLANEKFQHDELSEEMSNSREVSSNDKMMEGFKKSLKYKDIQFVRDLNNSLFAKTQEQEAIIDAMRHSWSGYRKYAWGYDQLRPISRRTHTWFSVGLTIIDSLDTLLLMGLEKEYSEAVRWIENKLTFEVDRYVNCFEMTIRILGGLLSAHHFTNSHLLLTKAVDVGDRLIHCFDSRSKSIPFSDVNLQSRQPKAPSWSQDSSLSEVTTVQLEFRDLTRVSGDKKFETISFRASEHIHNIVADTGESLLSMYINPSTGRFSPSTITLGARADSYYEYLLKQYLQTGTSWLRDDYVNAINAIKSRLIRRTNGPHKYTFVAELTGGSNVHPKMDHLVCFLPGTLALGHYHYIKSLGKPNEWPSTFKDHLQLAEELAKTCYAMYNTTATGLAPEISYFSEDPNEPEIQIRPADTHNLLRPEYVESLFYLYHLTDNEMYRKQGWLIFKAFEKYCKVPTGGFTSIGNVRNPSNLRPKDMQESFWLAETLKYLYLLFSDDKPMVYKLLNHYVINTEGHALPTLVEV